MKQVQMTHAQYMQRQHGLVGHLYQGRFKAKHVETENQLIYLSAYIHINPRLAGLVFDLSEWQWSSYPDYSEIRQGTIPDKKILLSHFHSPRHYKNWVDRLAAEKTGGTLYAEARTRVRLREALCVEALTPGASATKIHF